jgi:hypothetical protein
MAVQSRKLGRTADAKLPLTEQRQFLVVFSLLAAVRLHFALSTSYIHPDEHFQGPEVVVGTATIRNIQHDANLWQVTCSVGKLRSPGNSPIITLSTVLFGA